MTRASSSIYKVTHLQSGKIYIGQTKGSLSNKLKCIKSYKTEIGKLMRKEGIKSFSIEEIEKVFSIRKLKEREKFHIKHHNSNNSAIGFNLTKGGEGMPRTLEKLKSISVCMPQDLFVWLEKKTKQNRRSKSAEIIIYLYEKKAEDPH